MPQPDDQTPQEEYVNEPWTTLTEMRMRAADPKGTLISLLTNEAGALLLAKGIVPAYIKEQCKEALEWSCTTERAPAADRTLFDDIAEEEGQ